MRVLLVVVLAALFSACATVPAARKDGPSEKDLAAAAQARADAQRILAAQADVLWAAWSGGQAGVAIPEAAGNEAVIASVRRVRLAEKDPARSRALEYLEAHLVSEHLARVTGDVSERIAGLEASATITVDGEEKPYLELERLLATEPSRQRRRRMQAAALPVIRQLNPLHQERQKQIDAAVKALGYGSYTEVAALLRHSSIAELEGLGAAVMQRTETVYRTAFGEAVRRELREELAGLRRADVPRLFAGIGFEPRFAPEGAREALLSTLGGLGLDPAALRIDDEERPGKMPRPICFPYDPPSDVRLSWSLAGIGRDWAPLFHEAGCAVYHAGINTPVWEFRQLGGSATAEAFAVLFQRLTEDPAWLRERTAMTAAEANAHAAGAAVRRLYQLRRAAGKLQWELAMHRGGAADPKAGYRSVMEAAYLFPLGPGDAERYLVDHDEFLQPAETLQAWALAGMIEDHLVRTYGERWWASPEAGQWLGSLWAEGTRLTVGELAAKLGAEGLQPTALVSRLEAQAAPLLVTLQPAVEPAPEAAAQP